MDAPIDLNLARSLVAVHETGSFSLAGVRLGVPRSTVSRAVASLEGAIGVVLFHRTTRKVTTTAAGRALYQRVLPALASLEGVLSEASESEAIAGMVRVTSTVDLGLTVLAEAVSRFTARYPDVTVDLNLSNSIVDIVGSRIDLALRIAVKKKLPSSSLIARKIGRIRVQLYAAPAYLARKGTPRVLADLAEHDGVGIRGGQPEPLRLRVIADDMLVARDVLRTGAGIGILPAHVADADVDAGLLVRVLPQWLEETGTLYVVQATAKHVPKRVTLLRDLIVDQVKRGPFLAPS